MQFYFQIIFLQRFKINRAKSVCFFEDKFPLGRYMYPCSRCQIFRNRSMMLAFAPPVQKRRNCHGQQKQKRIHRQQRPENETVRENQLPPAMVWTTTAEKTVPTVGFNIEAARQGEHSMKQHQAQGHRKDHQQGALPIPVQIGQGHAVDFSASGEFCPSHSAAEMPRYPVPCSGPPRWARRNPRFSPARGR